MTETIGPPSGFEYSAHEDSERVEMSERRRAFAFVFFSFLVVGFLLFYFFSEEMARFLTQQIDPDDLTSSTPYLASFVVLALVEIGTPFSLLRDGIKFSHPKMSKQRGFFKIIVGSFAFSIFFPMLLYWIYTVLESRGEWDGLVNQVLELLKSI